MSAEDRAKQALETLARALASEGTLRASVRDLRARLGEARVKLLDQVVSTIAQHPVNTQPRRLFKQAASLAAEALTKPSEPPAPAPRPPPRPAPPKEVRRPPTPAKAEPKRPVAASPNASRLVLMARDPEWLYAYWELEPGPAQAIELGLFDADTGVRVDELQVSSADLHASFRRPGAGRRFAAILDASGKIRLRSGVVEVPAAAAGEVEAVRFVAPRGRSPAIVAEAIKEAPLVSPARILGWSPELWRSWAQRVGAVGGALGSSPGST